MEETALPALPFLLDCVNNEEEAPIVRHEVLVSIGDLVTDKKVIEQFIDHPELIVSQSCEVAFSYIDNRVKILEQ